MSWNQTLPAQRASEQVRSSFGGSSGGEPPNLCPTFAQVPRKWDRDGRTVDDFNVNAYFWHLLAVSGDTGSQAAAT